MRTKLGHWCIAITNQSEGLDRTEVNREELLDYIRGLHTRYSEQDQRTGLTKWALAGAVVYLIWQVVPQLADIGQAPAQWLPVCSYYAQIMFMIMGATAIFGHGRRRSSRGILERRIASGAFNPMVGMAQLSLILVVPGICAYMVLASELASNAWLSLQMTINQWVFVIIMVAGVMAFAVDRIVKWRLGIPSTVMGVVSGPWIEGITNAILHVLFLELFLGNLALLLSDLFGVAPVHEVLLCGFNLSLIAVALAAFLEVRMRGENMNALAWLEHDIIFENLDVEIARERLQEEIVGRSLGGWMTERMRWLRAASNSLRSHEAQVAGLIDESKVTPVRESMMQIRKHIDILERDVKKFWPACRHFEAWLLAMLERRALMNDTSVQQVVERLHAELKRMNEETTSAVKTMIERLRNASEVVSRMPAQ